MCFCRCLLDQNRLVSEKDTRSLCWCTFPRTLRLRKKVVAMIFATTSTSRTLISLTTTPTLLTVMPRVLELGAITTVTEVVQPVKPRSVLLNLTAIHRRLGVVVTLAMDRRRQITRVPQQTTMHRTTTTDANGDGDPRERTLRIA